MRPPSATGDFFYFEHFYDYRKYDKKIIYNYNDLNLTTSVDGPCLEKIFFSAVEKIAKDPDNNEDLPSFQNNEESADKKQNVTLKEKSNRKMRNKIL